MAGKFSRSLEIKGKLPGFKLWLTGAITWPEQWATPSTFP